MGLLSGPGVNYRECKFLWFKWREYQRCPWCNEVRCRCPIDINRFRDFKRGHGDQGQLKKESKMTEAQQKAIKAIRDNQHASQPILAEKIAQAFEAFGEAQPIKIDGGVLEFNPKAGEE